MDIDGDPLEGNNQEELEYDQEQDTDQIRVTNPNESNTIGSKVL